MSKYYAVTLYEDVHPNVLAGRLSIEPVDEANTCKLSERFVNHVRYLSLGVYDSLDEAVKVANAQGFDVSSETIESYWDENSLSNEAIELVVPIAEDGDHAWDEAEYEVRPGWKALWTTEDVGWHSYILGIPSRVLDSEGIATALQALREAGIQAVREALGRRIENTTVERESRCSNQ